MPRSVLERLQSYLDECGRRKRQMAETTTSGATGASEIPMPMRTRDKDLDEAPGGDGARGRAFEDAFLKGAELLGMRYVGNSRSGRLWDIQPIGPGWKLLIRGDKINVKIAGTKWLFMDSALPLMLPWTTDQWNETTDVQKLTTETKAHLDALGVADVVWLSPLNQQVETAIRTAVAKNDVPALKTLYIAKNFQSWTMEGYEVRLTIARGAEPRIGSVSLRKGGRSIARSEKPRSFGGTVGVGFKKERPDMVKHPAATKTVTSPKLVEAVRGGREPRALLRESIASDGR